MTKESSSESPLDSATFLVVGRLQEVHIFCYYIKKLSNLHAISDTAVTEIEDTLKKFIRRDDIDIILINQNVAELVRTTIDGHTAPVPAILEIPSKDHPYDPTKDSILRRAKGMFNPEDMR